MRCGKFKEMMMKAFMRRFALQSSKYLANPCASTIGFKETLTKQHFFRNNFENAAAFFTKTLSMENKRGHIRNCD